MKIAVASSGTTLDVPVDPRFGRCPFFLVVDTDTLQFEVLENQAAQAGGGAGIQAAQAVARAGAEGVIAGNFGPNAFQALTAGGIPVYTGATGTVAEAVQLFKDGKLQELEGASVPSHFGTAAGTPAVGTPPFGGTPAPGMVPGGGMMGPGGGRGMGGGGGMGGGRGMGQGGGRGLGGGGGRGGSGGRGMGGGRGGR